MQIAGFLIALRTKGETVEELAGLARTMRELAAPVPARPRDLLDTAGTGGGRRTFNVSTTAALIAAGAGCTVAKHGNRSATGLSGSADLLEALGARIDLVPVRSRGCIDDVGFGFMFAPAHHPGDALRDPVRRQLAVRTMFNFLGPLTNPAGATRQLIGVSDPRYLRTLAGALALLGTRHALLVSGEDGARRAEHLRADAGGRGRGGALRSTRVAPEEVGLARAAGRPVPGGDPAENAEVTRRSWRASPAPRATSRCSTRVPRSTPAARAETLADGVARPSRRSTPAPRRPRSTAFVELDVRARRACTTA